MAGAMNPKRMSLDTLLGNADQIAAEIQRRIEMLDEAQKKLGVVGLRLQASGMQRAVVRFPGNGYKVYEYDVPITAAVGDTVKTPTSFTGGQSLAEIVSLGTRGYTGPVKEIVALYKKEG